MSPKIQRLFLAAPLTYLKTENGPFVPQDGPAPDEERLRCFEIEPSQMLEFEPDGASFIKSLVFSGKAELQTAMHPNEAENPGEGGKIELPAGNYLFSQTEGRLSEEEILDMAIELQKEGLWQRLVPGNCFYLRFLHEDGRDVTQVFRPYSRVV